MSSSSSKKNEKVLLVMDGDVGNDWCGMFEGCTLSDGSTLRIVQVITLIQCVMFHGK